MANSAPRIQVRPKTPLSHDQEELPKLDPYIERATQLLDETLELVNRHEKQQDVDENKRALEKPPEQMLTALAQRTARKLASRKRHVKDKWLLLRDVAATSMTAVALSAVPVKVPSQQHGQNTRQSTAESYRLSSERQSSFDAARNSYVPLSRYLPLTSKEYAEVHREVVTRDGIVEKQRSAAAGEEDGLEKTAMPGPHVNDDAVAHAFKMLADAVSVIDWNKRTRTGAENDGGRLSHRAQAAALLNASDGGGAVTVRRIGCYTRDDANNTFCTYQAMDGTRFELPCTSAASPEMMPYEIRLFNARIRRRALDDTRDKRYEQLWRSKRRHFLRAAETIKNTLFERQQRKAGKKCTRFFNPLAQINEFVDHHRDELKYNRVTYDADSLDDDDLDDNNLSDYFASKNHKFAAGLSPPNQNRHHFWRRTHRIKSRRRWRNVFSTNLPVQRHESKATTIKRQQLAIMTVNQPPHWHSLNEKLYDKNFGFDESQAAAHQLAQQPIDYTGRTVFAQIPTNGLAAGSPPLSWGRDGGENGYTSRRRLSPRFRRILPEVDRSLVNIVATCEMRRHGERMVDMNDNEMPFFRRVAREQLKQVDRLFKAQTHQRGSSEKAALLDGNINQVTVIQTIQSPFMVVTGQAATLDDRQKKLNLRSLLYQRYFDESDADKEVNDFFNAGGNNISNSPSSVLMMDDRKSMKLFMKMLNRDLDASEQDELNAKSTTSLQRENNGNSDQLMRSGEVGGNKNPLRQADSAHFTSNPEDEHERDENTTDEQEENDRLSLKLRPHDDDDEMLSDYDNGQHQPNDAVQPLEEFMDMFIEEQQDVLNRQQQADKNRHLASCVKTPNMPVIKRCFSLFNLQAQFRTTVPYADGFLRKSVRLYRTRSAPAILQHKNNLLANAFSPEAVHGLSVMQLIRSANRRADLRRGERSSRNKLLKPQPADYFLQHHDTQRFDELKRKALTQQAIILQTNRYAKLQALDVLCMWKEVAHIAYFEKTKTLFELGKYQEAWSALTEAIHTSNNHNENFDTLVAAFIYRALLEETRLPQRAFLDALIGINLENSASKPLHYLRASILLLFARHYMLIDNIGETDNSNFIYALRAISQIFDLNFTSIHLHKAAASLKYQLSDANDAVVADHLKTVLEQFDPCNLHVLLALVQVSWRQRKFTLALRNISRALHIAPHLSIVHLMAALLNESVSDDKPPAEVTGVPEQPRSQKLDDLHYANFCRIEYSQNDLCSAAAVFILARRRCWTTAIRAVHRMHPSDITFNYRLLYLIGKIRYEQRRWTECVNVLEHCLAIFDKCFFPGTDVQLLTMRSKLSYFLALAYLHINNGSGDDNDEVDEKAKQCLICAVNLDEKTASNGNTNRNEHALRLLLILRWHWCQYQDDDEAELLFDDAVAKFPSVFGYWYARARFYISQRRYARAVSNLSEALRCEPLSVDAYYLRALLKMLSRAMPQALEDLSMAVKIQPHNPALRFLRGFVHHSQARLDDALDDYNKGAMCVTTMPTRTLQAGERKKYEHAYYGILHNRVLVYLKQRDYRRAAADLARLYLCQPKTWQYAYTLAYAWQKAGMLDLAQRLLESAVQKFPSCSAMWTSLGILHFTLQPFQGKKIR